ncbi:MAG TPA: HlyD family efflux transporter periplasmic adaptor subunit [Candidatus Paceibacterota bacterium]|jgi:HlyD family secretion protein|nr:HlyD family efflux transporter periplasmic adaptor subunit [Candidatus Paceibacterota bacterium]
MPSSLTATWVYAKKFARAHKVWSVVIAVVVIGGGYLAYSKITASSAPAQYVFTTVQTGTIVQTVSGSGQVTPSNEVILNPQASGQISGVLVKDDAHVNAGQAIAYINSTDEYNSVQSAKASLQSAQLNLQKLQEPPTQLQLTQDQDAIAKAQASLQSDQTALQNEYGTAYSDVVATFLDLPTVETQLQDIVTGTEAARGAQWNIDFYQSALENWDSTDAIAYRTTAFADYTAAQSSYTSTYPDFQKTSAQSSTSTVLSILKETYTAVQSEQTALNGTNSFIQFYVDQVNNHNQTPVSEANTSLTTLSSDITKVNSHLTALQNDQNQITSDQQALVNDQATITEDQESLQQLQQGADQLSVQSDQLAIQQQQNALQQAEDQLANYTITAPIAGVIADLNLNVGDTVGSGTNAATLITNEQIADLSLNEVDAAKVQVGQNATLTFDAIPNLSLTGTVTDLSPLGTVSQGVVSYDVKIAFTTQDPRVKAGMTVNADIQSAVHSNVLEVPASAIKTLNGQSYVQAFSPPLSAASGQTVSTNAAPQNIPVTIGISDNTNTEIITGLTAGQQIVARVAGGNTTSAASTATTRGGFTPGGGGGAVIRGGL